LPKTGKRVGNIIFNKKNMKNFLSISALLLSKGIIKLMILLLLTTSIDAQGFYEQPRMNSPQEFRENGYSKIGIAFRRHPTGNKECICPGCVCPGCTCPIGICICKDARPVTLADDQNLSHSQIAAGYGIAWVKIVGTELHLIFETPNDENDILIVNSSPIADDTDALKFGVSSSFRIENGTFTVLKTKYAVGEVVLAISYL
jgi:hypothetical protein